MASESDIRDKLAKLEALFARGATEGERAAAGAARERLQARLSCESISAPNAASVTEMQYTLPDVWSVRIFVALCRKYGVHPYRYPRQRRTTVMVKAGPDFDRTVVAEFRTLHRELTAYFNETVEHLISDAMKSDGDDEALEQRQLSTKSAAP
ncbi:hypothetical protein [Paenirhodobacter populi]|uniref:DUF2786 domain-containing protein n=1 Tax=Paenirhodobacter populi TaxID=2306993 RepID=A0A443IJ79_9RHOB|nr:hypothetical protein [Sinirhodobacter populi]RWR04248.1 hypothetical protein D2T33_21260 [Sinirhodobacter populi]